MDINKNLNEPENTRGKEDKDLPGYPHYPPEEDIMNPRHGFKKVTADEELANSMRLSSRVVNEKTRKGEPEERTDNEDDLGIVHGTEADVTSEDLLLLGEREADQDMNDDELTREARVNDVDDEQEAELDVPGSELDDNSENIGEEDEENNYYSLGGDRHENLEEDAANDNV